MVKKIFNSLEEYIIGCSLLVMAVINFANVLSRYVLHASWAFTEEITTGLFVFSTFLGAAVAAKRGSHLGLSVCTDLLPRKYQKYVTLFTVLCAISLFAVLLKYGIKMVLSQMKYGQTTPALGWPEWVFGLAIPVGALFLMIRFVQLGVSAFTRRDGD